MTLQISLSGGTTTLALPPDLEWQDEFDWTPVEHSTDYSNTGSLIVHEGERQDGRPIILWGQSFNVMFRRPPLQAKPIRRLANPGPEHQYAVTINLMEINP